MTQAYNLVIQQHIKFPAFDTKTDQHGHFFLSQFIRFISVRVKLL